MHEQPKPLQQVRQEPPLKWRKVSEAERKAGVQRWVAHKTMLYEAYEKGKSKA